MESDSKLRQTNVPKAESPIWKELKPYKGSVKTNGEAGSKKRYFEWDYEKNEIEMYNHRHQHLGSLDPKTGKVYGSAVPGRTLKKL